MCRVVGFFTTRQLCSQLNVSSSAERAWRSFSENADHFYPPEPMVVGSLSLLLPAFYMIKIIRSGISGVFRPSFVFPMRCREFRSEVSASGRPVGRGSFMRIHGFRRTEERQKYMSGASRLEVGRLSSRSLVRNNTFSRYIVTISLYDF